MSAMQRLEDTSSAFAIGVAILLYSLCSSTLLLANKLAMAYLPSPAGVSFLQILFGAVVVIALKYCKITPVDDFDWAKSKAYAMYVVAFVSCIFANMQALQYSNVETVIVFRACSPIAVSIIEYIWMDRAMPSLRSSLSLLTVAVGAIVYCVSDSEFAMKGISAYTWAFIYFFWITFEMTYGKNLTSSVKMESVWGPVLYCNAFAALPMFMLGYVNGDFIDFGEKLNIIPTMGLFVLFFSCVVGTLIGYTGWLCRGMVSATTYTLVGVVNKFLTVLLNVLIWDKHSSPLGLTAVCCCLLAGCFYQQSPKRDVKKANEGDIEMKAPLVNSSQQK